MKRLLALCLLLAVAACAQPADTQTRQTGLDGWLAASVQLYSERDGGKRRFGSGVVLGSRADGRVLIATANHVLRPDSDEIAYAIDPTDGTAREITILATDAKADLALVETQGLMADPALLKATGRLGDEIWVVSFPWGRRGTLATGIVSQVDNPERGAGIPSEGSVRLIDAAVSYGTSGGGVFDGRTGRLVGIVRGYRTARLALPGTQQASLELPIAGETTVVPTSTIFCLLTRTEDDVAAAYGIAIEKAVAQLCDSQAGEQADASN